MREVHEQTASAKGKRGIISELAEAGLAPIALITTVLAGAYCVVLLAIIWPFTWPPSIEKLGQFGDAFGALTSLLNALALAALVATVVLQSRELRETRKELRKQAEAQAAYVAAAERQIMQTKELEHLKLRPMLKAEWLLSAESEYIFEYRMRNVGVGPAIIDRIDVIVDGFPPETLTNQNHEREWSKALHMGGGPLYQNLKDEVRPVALTDHNRVLLPAEPQAIVQVVCRRDDFRELMVELQKSVRAEIHFRSLSGDAYTLSTQLPSRVSLGS